MVLTYTDLSTKLNATPKRLSTIFTRLFGDVEVSLDVAEPHIAEVLKRIKRDNLTVFDACDAYKLEVTKQHQTSPSTTAKASNTPGNGSVSALLESDRKATRKLSQKRYAAIVRESNSLLADWLSNGLPDDELSDELEGAIFDSDDMVLDALSEAIDSQGSYSYPKALAPSQPSIAHLLLPSHTEPTPNISNGNGKHSK
ncbi:hypothetical protein [Laspinema olomoucense]|uniref:Uncharacterized protein n=1 Tax=Laspinema olomoucense D3b TaxID=2953688 RepID=A0ABT2NJQ7_9CYAN|nr:hypothetical protein [Laspinema sp. D3b]MCT7981531.1 hypothetical protein [Laspinema sp. D3b]